MGPTASPDPVEKMEMFCPVSGMFTIQGEHKNTP